MKTLRERIVQALEELDIAQAALIAHGDNDHEANINIDEAIELLNACL